MLARHTLAGGRAASVRRQVAAARASSSKRSPRTRAKRSRPPSTRTSTTQTTGSAPGAARCRARQLERRRGVLGLRDVGVRVGLAHGLREDLPKIDVPTLKVYGRRTGCCRSTKRPPDARRASRRGLRRDRGRLAGQASHARRRRQPRTAGVPRRPAGQRRRRRLTSPPARRARITSFILARSPSPTSAPSTSSARSDHVQLAYWGAGRDDARGRRPARSPSSRATARCWVKRPSTGVARTGDETPLISRTTSKRPQTADNEVSRKRTKNPVLPGISPPFEAFDRTTENRGVPGSSPGLAIANPRGHWMLCSLVVCASNRGVQEGFRVLQA